jgi:hypoxanthine phosphoribosyltransferase
VTSKPRFAHASEAELARILDYYGVAWQYEPRTFPIQWNPDGKVVESFSPDFFLPELELYVELTTLKQSLVRRKNRKLRRLRELYPDIRVKLFYGKDFRALMLKYGRVELAASLSGLEGQIMPEPVPDDELAVEPVGAGQAEVEPAPLAHRSRPRVSRGSRRRRGRRAYLAARNAA